MRVALLVGLLAVVVVPLGRADWPQGAGPRGDFQVAQTAPITWSVELDQNIAWQLPLPETGQSTPRGSRRQSLLHDQSTTGRQR